MENLNKKVRVEDLIFISLTNFLKIKNYNLSKIKIVKLYTEKISYNIKEIKLNSISAKTWTIKFENENKENYNIYEGHIEVDISEIIKLDYESAKDKELALKWWSELTLEERQNTVYHYCTGNEIGSMEFEIKHIIEIWKNKKIVLIDKNQENKISGSDYLEIVEELIQTKNEK